MTKHKAFSLIELSIVILIIGVLVAGITKGRGLYAKAKLSAAARVDNFYHPQIARIDNMAMWYDSTQSESFDSDEIIDGGKITNLYDLNPSATTPLNLSQGSDAIKPLYDKSAINGLPAIYFTNNSSGNQRFLSRSMNINSFTKNGREITIFVVQKLFGSSYTPKWANGSNRIIAAIPHSSNNIYFDFGACCPSNSRQTVVAPDSLTGKTSLTTLFRNVNIGNSYVRVNGKEIINGNGFTRGVSGSASFIIGQPLLGFLGEMIIFKEALSSKEVSIIEQYLGQKWGITLAE